MKYQHIILVSMFFFGTIGCSSTSTPSGNNNNNNNNGGTNAVGVVGPTIGSVYLTSMVNRDTNGVQYGYTTYDTAVVINNTLTFAGRTNVTQTSDHIYFIHVGTITVYYDTNYYGYDAAGDFYTYDKANQGWNHYPVASKSTVVSLLNPQPVGLKDTLWGLRSTFNFVGSETQKVNGVDIAVLNASDYSVSQANIQNNIELSYANSIKFYVRLLDSLNTGNPLAINPMITSTVLKSYTLKP